VAQRSQFPSFTQILNQGVIVWPEGVFDELRRNLSWILACNEAFHCATGFRIIGSWLAFSVPIVSCGTSASLTSASLLIRVKTLFVTRARVVAEGQGLESQTSEVPDDVILKAAVCRLGDPTKWARLKQWLGCPYVSVG